MIQVIVVDDERIILTVEAAVVRKVLPNAEIAAFRSAEDAMAYAADRQIDIAFLDINMEGYTGLELAKILQAGNPKCNIIFCTGYAEYAIDAYSLYAGAYLMKPISEEAVAEAVSKLRFPIQEKQHRIRIQCFGSFEAYCDEAPIRFKYVRTKELLALLIDRRGALLNSNEIMAAIFGDEMKDSYVRNLKADLATTFQRLGVEDVLILQKGLIGIRRELVECDYYAYLDGEKNLFHGEYMTQYSFGEETLGYLVNH